MEKAIWVPCTRMAKVWSRTSRKPSHSMRRLDEVKKDAIGLLASNRFARHYATSTCDVCISIVPLFCPLHESSDTPLHPLSR